MLVSAVQQSDSATCAHISSPSRASLLPCPHIPALWVITGHWTEPPALHSSSPLATDFTHSSVRTSMLLFQFVLPSPLAAPSLSTYPTLTWNMLVCFQASLLWQRICLQCRSCRRRGFDPWVGKIPWRRAWQSHSTILAWRIPWTEEPGGLQSVGLQRVKHFWSNLACVHAGNLFPPLFLKDQKYRDYGCRAHHHLLSTQHSAWCLLDESMNLRCYILSTKSSACYTLWLCICPVYAHVSNLGWFNLAESIIEVALCMHIIIQLHFPCWKAGRLLLRDRCAGFGWVAATRRIISFTNVCSFILQQVVWFIQSVQVRRLTHT